MSDSIGYALIVNVKYFEDKDDNREDTIDDQINTVRAFKELGFETKLVTEDEDVNITASRFDSALQEGEASATMYNQWISLLILNCSLVIVKLFHHHFTKSSHLKSSLTMLHWRIQADLRDVGGNAPPFDFFFKNVMNKAKTDEKKEKRGKQL